jgi:hypothetical protein
MKRSQVVAVLATLLCSAAPAFAYRPFDSTDADVAKAREWEIELGSAYHHDDDGISWAAPALIANYGISDTLEAVLEGQADHFAVGRSEFTDVAASLKAILREGSLQGGEGFSLATELSALLPGVGGDDGAGFELAGIASREFGWGMVHFNLGAGRARSGNGLVFLGTILEGPMDWIARPVAEFRYEREFDADEEIAVLIGLVHPVSETLSFDVAIRHAWINGRPDEQIRAGLTVSFQ